MIHFMRAMSRLRSHQFCNIQTQFVALAKQKKKKTINEMQSMGTRALIEMSTQTVCLFVARDRFSVFLFFSLSTKTHSSFFSSSHFFCIVFSQLHCRAAIIMLTHLRLHFNVVWALGTTKHRDNVGWWHLQVKSLLFSHQRLQLCLYGLQLLLLLAMHKTASSFNILAAILQLNNEKKSRMVGLPYLSNAETLPRKY